MSKGVAIVAAARVGGDAITFPLPDSLIGKDQRADPVVRAAVKAVDEIIHFLGQDVRCDTVVIGVTATGSTAHIDRVVVEARRGRARPASFVRAGHQTIASHPALAYGLHGGALTLLGDNDLVSLAHDLAHDLLTTGLASAVIVVEANRHGDKVRANATLVQWESMP